VVGEVGEVLQNSVEACPEDGYRGLAPVSGSVADGAEGTSGLRLNKELSALIDRLRTTVGR
jgi:hypothetical protein